MACEMTVVVSVRQLGTTLAGPPNVNPPATLNNGSPGPGAWPVSMPKSADFNGARGSDSNARRLNPARV
jgi:hypothetical protein